MSGLDIAILAVFFVSALIGALRGFTKEVLSLFSWGGAISLSYLLLPLGRAIVQPYIANPMMVDGVALFSIFIIALIILSIVANIIAGYIHESSFRGVDHSLGFGFGMLRGVVFISATELIFSTFSPRQTQSPTIQSARFIPMVRRGGDIVLDFLPTSLRNLILEQALKVEEHVNAKAQENLKHALPAEGIKNSLMSQLIVGNPTPGGPASESGMAAGQHSHSSSYPPTALPSTTHNAQPQGPFNGGTHQHEVMAQPQVPTQSGMVVIHPQPPSSGTPLVQTQSQPPYAPDFQQGGSQVPSPYPQGLGQRGTQDRQKTVDELSRLRPQSSPKEDAGYTKGQRDDMNRLFQSVEGE
ncbi:MAG: hypothetical protein FJX03_00425 [Alphaproteobacteria bacterium]|nr:hypothetical protein [Alphaproteobacteria bacterium]